MESTDTQCWELQSLLLLVAMPWVTLWRTVLIVQLRKHAACLYRGFPESRPVFSPPMGAYLRWAFIWSSYLSRILPVFVPVTLHGTSNVIPYWVWILFVVVVTLHQWSANFFIAVQITFSIAIKGPLYLKPLEQNFKCVGFVCMCSCSDTGNMQLPYNSPGGYLVHALYSQFVFFSN